MLYRYGVFAEKATFAGICLWQVSFIYNLNYVKKKSKRIR